MLPSAKPLRSPQLHASLIAAYAKETNPLARAILEASIDAAGGQRYGYISQLYWYTDLGGAQAAAKAQRKPILSLRLLGNLTEELTCANSRFFRVMYYANSEISAYLRDNYVLHWSSERPVPKVTVDFGDGRVLKTTVTGNSIHYVLDEQGRVIDYLPSLQAPNRFLSQVRSAKTAWQGVEGKPEAVRYTSLLAFHTGLRVARADAQRIGDGQRLALDIGAQLDAQSLAITKMASESLVTRGILPPGTFADPTRGERDEWARRGAAFVAASAETPMFDAASLALMRTLRPDLGDAQLRDLEQSVLADTAIGELVLRTQIDSFAPALRFGDLAALNRVVYDNVFLTRGDDPWLNMASLGVFDGLPVAF